MAGTKSRGARKTINNEGGTPGTQKRAARAPKTIAVSFPSAFISRKITVLGLWHLGCVTAACCAKHFQVTGLDFDASTVAKLNTGHAPLLEAGLDELISTGLAAKRLAFATDAAAACAAAD